MKSTCEKAYAKLNISLDVPGKRSDGYHDMLMIMQTVSLCDELHIELCDKGRSSAQSNLPYIPDDERNLAVKAANLFFRAADIKNVGARITLTKNIPVCAGMGGGSADAAAVLRALNRLTGAGFDREELEKIARLAGSDVAFCVAGGTALASGRGDELEDVPPVPDCAVVICKPDFQISTPELFKKLDSVKLRCHPDTRGILTALECGDLGGMARRMYNVFEDVPDRRMSAISAVKGRLLDCGAIGSVMTGTGSAVFGIFPDEASACAAADTLRREYKFCCAARPVGRLEI